MSDPVPTVLTGVHVAGRDDRLSHIELRHGAEPKKEDEDMTEAQFAELKAMLEPIAEVAAMQLAEYRRREAERVEWEAKEAAAKAEAKAEEDERQAKIVADKRAAAEKEQAEAAAAEKKRADDAAAAAKASAKKDETKD